MEVDSRVSWGSTGMSNWWWHHELLHKIYQTSGRKNGSCFKLIFTEWISYPCACIVADAERPSASGTSDSTVSCMARQLWGTPECSSNWRGDERVWPLSSHTTLTPIVQALYTHLGLSGLIKWLYVPKQKPSVSSVVDCFARLFLLRGRCLPLRCLPLLSFC